MAPKRRAFAELGSVASHAGSYSAEFSIREAERIRHIYGPRRRNKLRALGDLDVIRAAAAESESRADGFEAMEAAAKRLKADTAAEAGGVEKVGDEYRARVRCATASGEFRKIQGPCRLDDQHSIKIPLTMFVTPFSGFGRFPPGGHGF